MEKSAAQSATPQSLGGKKSSKSEKTTVNSSRQQSQFVGMALTMGWQLAVVVLVPIIGGVELGKAVGAQTVLTIIGLASAVLGSILVMWRTMQAANKLPVPKLSAAQKQAIQKSYAEDDKDD
jgi:hypothetical protein